VARCGEALNRDSSIPTAGSSAGLPLDTGVVSGGQATAAPSDAPSALYRAGFWRLGLGATRLLPGRLLETFAQSAAAFYARLSPQRRAVVVRNLLPACDDDRERAEQATNRLFRHFGLKLLDLWRFEGGLPIDHLFPRLEGRHYYDAALKAGRGVLLLTPHLGNWEFGAPLLAKNGYKLHVITLVEPGRGLTEMRQAARARWGIETLVIGRDPFAFVEIIRRVEGGATVALLVDRPPKTSAVEVQLFGRPFSASVAVAELARATGCELLPVYIVHGQAGYSAHILPALA